jgi:hypothetical protein
LNQNGSNVIKQAGNILSKIKIGNAFLFLGIFLIIVSFFSQLITGKFMSDTIPVINLVSIKIGLITLIFGGIFSLLSVLTNPFQNMVIYKEKLERNIDPFNKESLKASNYKLFLDLLNRYEKNILFSKKTSYKEIEGNNWNNLFIYSLWMLFLLFYILWINVVVEIIPLEIDIFAAKIYSYYFITIIAIVLIILIIYSFRKSKHHINAVKQKN